MAVALLDSLKKVLGKKRRKSQAFAWLADLERESGDLDTALDRVNGGLTLYPDNVPAMLVRSAILFQKEDFQGCIEECEKVLVADPFCLSAQKRMGDAYDKLGNENSRNLCYRRVHDMDPLDPFWKEEYEKVTEEVESIAPAVAEGVVLAESDFAMPSDNLDLSKSDDETLDMPADSAAEASEESLFEKAPDSSASMEAAAPAETAGEAAPEQPAESPAESDGGSLFEKSASESLFEKSEEISTAPASEQAAEPAAPEQSAEQQPAENPFASAAEAGEEDPFAALAAILPSADAGEEAVMDSLQASLDSAMAEMANDEPSAPEVFPTDEEAAQVSGNDVNSALSDMFGIEDDLEPEEPAEPASPFAHLDLPSSLEEENPAAEENAKNVFSESDEDKPQSVDSAFDAIFGEDELPEEKPATPAPAETAGEAAPEQAAEAPAESDGGSLFEKSASESLFEKSATEQPLETESEPSMGSLFEKSASESVFGDAEPKADEAELNAADLNEDKPQSVDSAFDAIFGEDELPEEKPATPAPAETAGEAAPEQAAEAPADEVAPAAETAAESASESLFEKSASEQPVDDQSLELPADDLSLDLPADDSAQDKPAADSSLSLDNAFDSIFGKDSDDLPEEKPFSLEGNASFLDEDLSAAAPAETAAEQPAEPAAEQPAEPIAEPAAESVAETAADDKAFSVDSAFDSIFGKDDDDLPEEKPAETVAESAPAEAAAEQPAETLAEQVSEAETELELPAAEPAKDDDFANEMGGAFEKMFGKDDDLDLPELKPAAESAEPAQPSQEDTAAALEEKSIPEVSLESDLDKSFDSLFGKDDSLDLPEEGTKASAAESAPETAAEANADAVAPAETSSLESAVDGAFKGLFADDADDFPAEEKPSNKGVDFLMSGDSDDDVSNGLIKDPSAPLNAGEDHIDESLNTRTLAEIYYEQGLYGKALDIYEDLAKKDPDNAEIMNRLMEIEKAYREKFGGNQNG